MQLCILFLNLITFSLIWFNRQTRDRFRVTASVVAVQLVFMLAGEIEGAFAYYAACACFDLATVLVLSWVSKTKLSTDIQLINIWSMAIHGVGYVAYEFYVPSFYYNVALCAVLAIQIFRLTTTTYDDERDTDNSDLWDLVRRIGAASPQSSAKDNHEQSGV